LRNLYSCGRHKENTYGRYNVKYTVGVQVASGKIVYVSDAEPGSVPDITALRNSTLLDYLDHDDVLLADKGYQGHARCLTPFKVANGSTLGGLEKFYNESHASVRQIGMFLLFLNFGFVNVLGECVLTRLKFFSVLRHRFRCRLHLHATVFHVCAQITNVSMDFAPVYKKINPHLFL
jgi:hypothetical protein